MEIQLEQERQLAEERSQQEQEAKVVFLSLEYHCRKHNANSRQNHDAGLLVKLECGPVPNVMAALPNIPCSNAAKTRNPLKFAGFPQTRQTLSAASGPKFTIL